VSENEQGGRPPLPLLILGAVLIAAFVVLNRELPQIDLEQALHDVGSKLGSLTYLFVGLAAYLETAAFVGLILPGETVVIFGGAVAGQGETSLVLTIGAVWFCAWAGDTTSFLLGRRLGREFVMRHGPRLRITPERFRKVEAYFSRHGGKTILIGRFIGLVRALAPFSAGSSGMRYRDFVPFSILGTALWAAAFTSIGYFASQSLDEAARVAGKGTLLFGIVVTVVVGLVIAFRYLRVAENRERAVQRMEGSPVLRPLLVLGRRVQPPARFLWARITPGELGLQFTVLVAALAVGLYVVIAYGVVVSGDPGPTAGDDAAFRVADGLQTGWLTDVVKVVTELGSAAVTLPLALVAGAGLAIRRRWVELAVLVAGLVIVFAAVPALKDEVARPRPSDPLTGTGGYSWPSGHSAHAALYPWLALTAALRLRPGMAGSTALIISGFAVAAAVAASRVYLRAHYLSDATSGLALGIAAFAACGAVALVIVHVRQNARERAAGREDRN
jgi:undecaprenyl-diphosphatase